LTATTTSSPILDNLALAKALQQPRRLSGRSRGELTLPICNQRDELGPEGCQLAQSPLERCQSVLHEAQDLAARRAAAVAFGEQQRVRIREDLLELSG